MWGAHIIGGEIIYECLGYTNGDPATNSRTYRFTMKIYRDCRGMGADFDSAPFGAFTASVSIYQGASLFTTLYLAAPQETSIDPNPGNPCLIVPSNVCVEEGVYVFPDIDLPIVNVSYFVSYQRCCRNNTISNIINPGGSGATYTMELTPAAQASCNNSPVFDNFPPIVLCVGEEFTFDHSATDAEGDQLVYELCTPFLGGGLNFNQPLAGNGIAPDPDLPPPYNGVAFQAPIYTVLSPLGVDSELNLGLTSGILSGIPALTGQFVVGLCVSEYRNGVLMSVVRRDFQFNITQCDPTVVADIREDEIINGNEFLINSCGETRINFFNQSFQQSYISEYYWEFDINGNTQTQSTWHAVVDFPGPGQYQGKLVLNPGSDCGDTAHIRINIFPSIEADFEFAYDTCIAGPVIFTDLSSTGSGQITNWSWDFDDGNGSSNPNPEYRYREPGVRNVRLRVTDINQCQDEAVEEVRYFPVPDLIIVSPSSFTGCAPAEIFFNNLSTPIDDTYDILWDFGDGGAGDQISPTYTFESPGVFSVSLDITSPIGCRTDTVFTNLISIEPSPIADFFFTPENPDNFNPEVQFTDRSSGAGRWFWDFNGMNTSILPNPVFAFPDTGRQAVTLIVTHPSGCQDSITQYVDVQPRITFFMPNAFTPNDDSVNDVFKGEGFLRGVKQFRMVVWNRWGELIFETNDVQEGWNGRVGRSGKPAPPGVYICLVSMTGPRGEPFEWRGFATLIR